MQPSHEDVRSLMADYARDFGVALEFEDAERMLVLYNELCDLFEEYLGDVIDRSELVHPYPPMHRHL
jgi:hypothetical protein